MRWCAGLTCVVVLAVAWQTPPDTQPPVGSITIIATPIGPIAPNPPSGLVVQ